MGESGLTRFQDEFECDSLPTFNTATSHVCLHIIWVVYSYFPIWKDVFLGGRHSESSFSIEVYLLYIPL